MRRFWEWGRSRILTLCDSNVSLALVFSRYQHHRAALDWLASIEIPGTVCFCGATQQSLLRLLTTEAVMRLYGNAPLTNSQVWELCEHLLTDDRIVLIADEPTRLEVRRKALAARDLASPKAWMDAYLAGFALAGGYGLVTTDRAFATFPGLDLTLVGQCGDR